MLATACAPKCASNAAVVVGLQRFEMTTYLNDDSKIVRVGESYSMSDVASLEALESVHPEARPSLKPANTQL